MADGKKRTLPWGMTKDGLKPNSIESISKSKLTAFSLGMMNPLKMSSKKKKEEKKLEKKMAEAKETAEVFEEFVASFEDTGKTGKTFVRGSTFNPEKAASMSERPKPPGGVYKPTSRFASKEKKEEAVSLPKPTPVNQKPQKKKGTEKKKSILELFREELRRAQEERKDRHAMREGGIISLDPSDEPAPSSEIFEVEEYKSLKSGSMDIGESMTTNLYVGNINPKMNEETLCQMFGKFGPLASVKVMWPRTEEERLKKRNCGFVAYMKREDAEKALDHFKGTTVMDFEIQVGWGKAVPLPPQPIYVPPDVQADEKAKHPDPPSGLPFNAQPTKKSSHRSGHSDSHDNFDDTLHNALIRVVIPTDKKLLRLIHRMIEFVIREGPMFEAMIMNKEINNPLFQFLFDNQGPAHVYYRWKLFSILQGDSPETWRTEEFRMFEHGSLWKPPPLKNLRMKLLPPVEEDAVLKRGQLSTSARDELEDQLRNITMERGSIRKSMVWCLDHADSAEEIVDCVSEALTIAATPLPMKLARLFLVSDILHNCSSAIRYSSNFRRGFESKLNQIFEHINTVYQDIQSRMRAENFKRRVLACIKSWDMMSIFHFNFLDKLRESFFGTTQEEAEKQKAFNTVAALMTVKQEEAVSAVKEIDGVPLFDDKPIDFSGGAEVIDRTPLDPDIDGAPLPESDIDGLPLEKEIDIDGVPMEELAPPPPPPPVEPPVVRSKWELVDYDSDEEEGGGAPTAVSDQTQPTEKQVIQAETEEKKRRILRDVEVKVVELSDALESTGSYSKTEIAKRVEKYRDKLMNEAVEPKVTPPSSPEQGKRRSRSPSPATLSKYKLERSPRKRSPSDSPRSSPERKRSKSPRSRSQSSDHSSSCSPPPKRIKSRDHSSSPSRRRSRSRDRSRKRSRSPKRRRSRDRSPARKRSSSPTKRRSRSRSPKSRRRSRSRSPQRRKRSSSAGKRRSRSRSPRRKRSRSPRKSRNRSRSPKSHRHKSRSKSPSKSSKKRKRSRSPRKSSKSGKKSSRH